MGVLRNSSSARAPALKSVSILIVGVLAFQPTLTVAASHREPQTTPLPPPLKLQVYDDPREALNNLPSDVRTRLKTYFARHPEHLRKTIDSAKKHGWKATAGGARFSQLLPASRLRPGLNKSRQAWFGDWGGEMLIWDWDDGNPDTQEATIQNYYYDTGESFTFNVQLSLVPPYADEVYAHWGQITGTDTGDGGTWSAKLRQSDKIIWTPVQAFDCEYEVSRNRWRIASMMAACVAGEVGGRLRDGLIGAGIGGAVRAGGELVYGGTMSQAIGVAVRGAPWGFVTGVIMSFRSGGPYRDCSRETMEHTWCEEERQTRGGAQ